MSEIDVNSKESGALSGDRGVRVFVDGVEVSSGHRRLSGRQIRELGDTNRVHGFKTEIVTGHVRVVPDHEELELHEGEHFRTVIEIYLDGELVISRSKTVTGRQNPGARFQRPCRRVRNSGDG